MKMKDSSSFKLLSHEDKRLIEHLKEVRENSINLINEINNYCKIDKYNDLKKLIELIAISHDFGKSSVFFQNKINNKNNKKNKLERHSLISALFGLFLLENYYSLSFKKGFPETVIFRCIRRHHGNLENFETDFKYSSKSESNYIEAVDIFKNIKENKQEVNDIYNTLLKSTEIDYVYEFEEYLGRLEKNKENTGKIPINNTTIFKFKNNDPTFFYYFNFIYSILLESDKKSASNLGDISTTFQPKENYLKQFKKRFDRDNEFNKIRERIYKEVIDNLEDYLINDKGKFFEIDAPTGSGKTLTMLGSAFKIREYLRSEKYLEPQIIYALPFISIIEQNYRVFKNVIEKVKGEVGDDVLLEHHHLADEVFQMSNEKEIDYSKSSFLIENWYSEIVVTTFFQLFKSVFTNKNHLLKKYNKLTNSIILIDEIQAVPPGLYTLIRDCLKILSEKFGSYIILATATKPKLNKKNDSKESKLNAFKLFDQDDSENIDGIQRDKYFNRYKVSTNFLNERMTLNDLGEILKEAVNLNNFMVVLNTINSTKEIYEKYGEQINYLYEYYASSNLDLKVNSENLNKLNNILEAINEYILFSPNSPPKKGLTYYKERDLTENLKTDAISLDSLLTKYMIEENSEYGTNKHYDDYNSANYKLKDLENDLKRCPYVWDYIRFDKVARQIIENNDERYTENEINIIKSSIGYNKNNSKEIDQDIVAVLREYIGYIYFNSPLRESESVDYDLFDIEDKNQILALLKLNERSLVDDLGCLLYDFNNLIRELYKDSFTDMEKEILELYRIEGTTQEDISEQLYVTQQYVSKSLNSICDKIIDKYWEKLEDWYYTFVVKGTYKQCSKCKENKLLNERYFGKNKATKDGFNIYCKKCRKD